MKILEQAINKINSNLKKKIHKKQIEFCLIMVFALTSSVGKKTMANLSRFSKITKHTFARQMAKAFDFASVNAAMITEAITENNTPEASFVAAVQDCSFLPKSGSHTPEMDYFWNGSAGRAEKGIEADAIGIIKLSGKTRTAFALHAQQTPANKTPKAERKKTKKIERTRVDFALDHVQKVKPQLEALGIKHMIADMFYSKIKYVNGLFSCGIYLIGKIRKDSRFLKPYDGPQKARGRKRLTTNAKITTEDFSPVTIVKTEDGDHELRDCIAYSTAFKRRIKVVSVVKKIGEKKMEIFLFSTDLMLDAIKIHELYIARFQVEFLFRDAKGFTGFNDCQSRNAKRIDYHLNASLMAVNVARIDEANFQKFTQILKPFSMANVTRKNYIENTLNSIFCMFDLDPSIIKSHPNYQKALSFGSIIY